MYQFASKEGAVEDFYKKGMSPEDRKYFDGINPRDWTDPNGKCAQAWQKWSSENDERAFTAQNNYMMSKYYPAAASSFKAQTGIDPSSNRALQEAVISTAVQHGAGGAKGVFSGLNSSMSNEEIVQNIYKDRSNVQVRFKSSPSLWNGLEKRLGCDEPKVVLGLLGNDSVPKDAHAASEKLSPTVPQAQTQISNDTLKSQMENPQPATKGFQDKDGVNPKPNRNDQPAVHRTARGETGDTALCHRAKNVLTENPGVEGNTWDEREPQAEPKYTNNVVTAGHGGVMVEMDNTKGSEGYRISHPTNSYQEIGADGDMVTRSNKNVYSISMVDTFSMVGKDLTSTIMGSVFEKICEDHIKECKNYKVKIFENWEEHVTENKKEIIGKDYELEITGKMTEKISGDYDLTCESNITETCSGNIKTKASQININANTFRVQAGMIYLN